jgi:hypothetical protein
VEAPGQGAAALEIERGCVNATIRTERDRQKAHDELDKLKLDGSRGYAFSLKQWRRKRSLAQNRMWHSWMRCMEQEAADGSYSKRWWEAHYKFMFLEIDEVDCRGHKFPMEPRTRDLDTAQFTEFLNKVKVDAWEFHDVQLPTPDDLGWDDFVARYDRERG